MKNIIRLISNKFNLIKPKKYEKNIFTIFSQRNWIIETADTETFDTELIIEVSKNHTAFLVTKFEGQEIKKFTGPCRKRLWLTILNQSYSNKLQIKKRDLIGYLLFEPDKNINVYYITHKKNQPGKGGQNAQIIIYPKTGQSVRKTTLKKKRTKKSQVGGFLNRYDFAYAGRHGKIAPKIVNQASGEINKIAQQRIDQIIGSGSAEIDCVAPKIIKGATEDVYKTPFRLLGNFEKEQFQKIKIKLFK